MPLVIDFDLVRDAAIQKTKVKELCDTAEEIYEDGFYPMMEVVRPWSRHNPVLQGELACPRAIRWFLERELTKLAQSKAKVSVGASRPVLGFDDPALFSALDEREWDLRKKKLILFRPERIALSLNRLEHYTGSKPEWFQRFVLFTNYTMHVEVFLNAFPDALRPRQNGVQMPAYHHVMPGNTGVTLLNIGVGPANAKTITDHLAVLRPDAMIMVGHCGGVRNHQEIGDLVIATAFMRGDRVMDEILPRSVPVASNHHLNSGLIAALDRRDAPYRIGTVYTTGNRNWEFDPKDTIEEMALCRAVAIDMESATIAANGFRYRIPFAALLSVSDKPLHGKPKLSAEAQLFYKASREQHLATAIEAIEKIRVQFPDGLPTGDIRSIDEPLLGNR
ncbi:MAG: AMP nucleosidase [Acidobacteria bacterium]|nr:AMP nucleosidase [Acidobacteriota bacterium]MCG3192935.1 AMP nucleosidase [Thermoanaerobaculia bacterium]